MPLTFNHLAVASPTFDVLGHRLIAAPQQQEAFVLPCFTFGSGSPPNAEAEQQATDFYNPSQHDNLLANGFSSAFNGLSLHDEHPGSSATAVDVSSSDTGNVFLCSACSGTRSRLIRNINCLAVHSPLF
jgi:hypothetical protein